MDQEVEVRRVCEEEMTGTSAKGKELVAEVRGAITRVVMDQGDSLGKGRVQAGMIRKMQAKLMDKPGDVGARDLPNIFNLKLVKVDKIEDRKRKLVISALLSEPSSTSVVSSSTSTSTTTTSSSSTTTGGESV